MADLPKGLYRIAFTNEQLLTTLGSEPGAPLVLLPPDSGLTQTWQVQSNGNGNGTHTISAHGQHVSYDGDPDMHEPALLLPKPREWRLIAGEEPDTYSIGVVDAHMRLGLSLLRIFPPRVALAPEYGDQFQAWTFRPAG